MTSSHSLKAKPAIWLMLLMRMVLFFLFQGLIALGLKFSSDDHVFAASAKWWPVSVVLTNMVGIVLLIRLFQSEGKRYRDLFNFKKETLISDLTVMLFIILILGPLGFFPNLLLANYLFGDNITALSMYIQPLPLWATLLAVVVFPLTQGLAELPIYFAYTMPRLEKQTGSALLALVLPAFFLAAQHIFAPLIMDSRFILWRLFMFMPFAFAIGLVLRWRPRLLPYLVVLHILMDLSLAPFFLGVI